MTAAEYVLGGALVLVVVAGSWIGGRVVRRLALPAWSGPPAVLVDVVLALCVVLAVSCCLGAVGGFRRALVPLGCAAAGGVLALAARARRRGGGDAPAPAAAPASVLGPAGNVVTVVAVAGLAGQWSARTASALAVGITNTDSLKYHLTFAARFAQIGWLTRLAYLSPEFPDTFHPANNEVLHAIGMVAFRHDIASPVLNLGWVAGVLLAAWCIGRPYGVAPLSTLGAAVVLATPLLNVQNAGTASNDVAVLFFLLAAVAVLLQPGAARSLPAIGVAAVAAGLALGTKLTAAGAVAALTVGVVVVAGRSRRARAAVAWLVPLALTGGYWYVRCWVRTGTPLPSVDLSALGLPAPRFATVERFGFSTADYLTDADVWRDWLLPGLRLDFGWVWLATFVAATAAVVLAVVAGPPVLRIVGAAAGLAAAVYVITPTTALGPPGRPLLFASNLAYLSPALAVALAALPVSPVLRRGRRPVIVLAALGALVVATWSARGDIPAWPRRDLGVGVAVAGAVVAVGLLAVSSRWVRRVPPSRFVPVGATVLVAVAALAWPVARGYVRDRYADDPRWAWAQPVRDQRIAIAGFGPQLPLYGRSLENRVQYVGEVGDHGEFHDIGGCEQWRRALRGGDYDLVVLASELTQVEGRELAWTRDDPAARELPRAGRSYVFAFDPTVAMAGC
jgi:hypothetical protein